MHNAHKTDDTNERKGTTKYPKVESRILTTCLHEKVEQASVVMAIHNAFSPSTYERVITNLNESPHALSTLTGKHRFYRYGGPPGTMFMQDNKCDIHMTQAPSALFTIFCSITDWILEYVKSFFTEEGLPGRLEGLGYTHTTQNVAQQIGGTPAGSGYAKHSDDHFTNTSPDVSPNPTTDEEQGTSEFLPTISELPVATFCIGDQLSRGRNTPQNNGLMEIRWNSKNGKPAEKSHVETI